MLKIILMSLGLVGGVIGLSGYLPQIKKLIKVKKSNQFSIWAWSVWLISCALVLMYAISIKDPVYIVLEILDTVFISIILIMIIRFRKNT